MRGCETDAGTTHRGHRMEWWQWALLGGFGLTVVAAATVVWMARGDASASAQRMRQQAIGMAVMTAVIPAWLLLEDELSIVPYTLLLVLVVGSGITVYLRGGGWRTAGKQ